jgi:hypothetical protein
VLAALACVAAARVGYPFWTQFPGGAGLLEDDSYFYAQIAYNIGTEGLSSFDGSSVTDGYHLLWSWILSATAALVAILTGDKPTHLTAMIAVYFFVSWLTGQIFGRTWISRVAVPFFAMVYSGLTEGPLLALALMTFVTFVYLTNDANDSPIERSAGYAAAALVPLIRIDASVILFVLVGVLMFMGRRRDAGRTMLFVAAGIAAQLIATYLTAGHFVSVSALVKALPDARSGSFALLAGNASRYLALTAFVVGVTLFALRRSSDARARLAGWFVLAMVAYLTMHLTLNRNVRYWYFMPVLMACLVLLDQFVAPQRRRVLAGLVVVLLAGFLTIKVHYIRTYQPEVRYAASFVAELSSLVPPGERIFVIDGAGYLGYFSGRPVIDGNGFVNTHEFATRRRTAGLAGYLAEQGIRYVVLNQYVSGPVLLDYHGLRLLRSEAAVLKEPPAGLRKMVAFTLFRVK